MPKVNITLRNAIEERDKEIALKFKQAVNGTTLRAFAKDAELDHTMVYRAVKKWGDWATAQIEGIPA